MFVTLTSATLPTVSRRLWILAAFAAAALASCAPPGTPVGARPHIGTLSEGLYWTTCVDTSSGFVELTNRSWGESVRAAGGVRCAEAPVENYSERGDNYSNAERAAVLLWLGEDRIELLAWHGPWRRDHAGACPIRPSRAAFATTAQTLEEAAASARFSPTQRGALQAAADELRQLDPLRLWASGSRGTHQDTEFYCAEIDHVLPETSPQFPEELKAPL